MKSIDPRHAPIRGAARIAKFYKQTTSLTTRQLAKGGLIDADRDGKIWVSTAARLTASPLITGRGRTASL